jgi:peptide/nickel transport system ATP-binding protein
VSRDGRAPAAAGNAATGNAATGNAAAGNAAAGSAVLRVRDLAVRFDSGRSVVHAVNGVSFDLEARGALGLVGESGSGKSVTSLAILRLLPHPAAKVVAGQVWLGDRDLIQLRDRELRRLRGKEISLVPQDPMSGLNPVLTVGEQIVETIRAHEDVPRREARRRAADLLGIVGLPQPSDQLERYPHQFSGGMRQRVLIAIALALQPALLIADEPTTALDVTVQAQVLELLHELTVQRGTAILLISHDLGIMARMTRRIMVMYACYLFEDAATAEIFASPGHPYTVGLLRSIPRIADVGRPLTPIAGSPPEPGQHPRGCPFAARCAWALDVCWQEMPPLEPVSALGGAAGASPGGHLLACHNPVAAEEIEAGKPRRPGFRPAPPPEDGLVTGENA